MLEPLAVGPPGILGRQGNRGAFVGDNAISADGRWVVFSTRSNNLDPSDRDANLDVYLAAADASSTQRISVTPPGAPRRTALRPSISPDGRWIAWMEIQGDVDAVNVLQLHDRATQLTTTVAASLPGTFAGFSNVAMSNDAARLAFQTDVPLVADDHDDRADAYVWTRADGTFRRVSLAPDGSPLGRVGGNVPITPDGRHVAFVTEQDLTIPGSASAVQVLDLTTGIRDLVPRPHGVAPSEVYGSELDLSADGRWLALASPYALAPEDINGRSDVYVFDRVTRSFELVSVSSAGAVGTCDSRMPSITGDGNAVAFVSCGRIAHPESGTIYAAFLRERSQGRTVLLSRPLDGGANFNERDQTPVPAASADGSRVAFSSASEQLVQGDTNRRIDAFVVDLHNLAMRRVGLATGSALPAGASALVWQQPIVEAVAASRSGEHVLFSTVADNLLLSRLPGALRTDTRLRVISDAVPLLLPGPRGATEIAQGISDDGSVVLVRRAALRSNFGAPPGLDVPRDLWLYGPPVGALRVDTDPTLGKLHEIEAAVLSGNGRRVAFLSAPSDTPLTLGVYRFDADDGTTLRIDRLPSGASPAVGAERGLAMSRDGRWLVFASAADALVAGDNNGSTDLFLADLVDGGLLRLSQPDTGLPLLAKLGNLQGMAVSDGGRRVVFLSDRGDLAPGEPAMTRLFLLDLGLGLLQRLSRADLGDPEYAAAPSISTDGRRVAYLGNAVLRVVELGPDASIVGEPTTSFPPIEARQATISPDGYAVALYSAADFQWVPEWLAADGATPLLLRLPEPALFRDGFEVTR